VWGWGGGGGAVVWAGRGVSPARRVCNESGKVVEMV